LKGQLLLRLLRESKSQSRLFTITLLLVLLSAGIVWMRPELSRLMLDNAVMGSNQSALIYYTVIFALLLVGEAVIQFFQTTSANRMAQSVVLDMRKQLFDRIIRFRSSFFDATPVGQIVTRNISDVDGIAEIFSAGLLDIFRDLLKLLVIVAFMFYIDWQLALTVILPIPILFWATRIFQKAVKKSFQDVRREVSRINVFVQEHVSGMSIVQAFNREEDAQRNFLSINQEHRDAHIRGIWAYSVFFPVVELLSACSVALMLWWGVGYSGTAASSPGLLLEFSTFITMMYRPIRQMADNFNVLQMGMVNAERVFNLLERDELEAGANGSSKAFNSPLITKGHVVLRQVRFSYNDLQQVLKGIDLEVKPGEMLALVGASGSGKTTIASLINRTYELSEGELSIDGRNIKEYDLTDLRTSVVSVSQDVFLFSDSIYHNISLHNEKIHRDDVVEACRTLGIHSFIMTLPGNYDYQVHERGALLSTGQRQLLAFARAYVHNPKILILDEATSSVDAVSEKLIQEATAKITRGRTSIVIAHRLSTVQQASHIAVVHKGAIIEFGTHESLYAMGGTYTKLCDLQFNSFV
jgi:ATP-binding cassette subfamily B multidrug efflux pump